MRTQRQSERWQRTGDSGRGVSVAVVGSKGLNLGVFYMSIEGTRVLQRTTLSSAAAEPVDFDLVFQGKVVGLGAIGNVDSYSEEESENEVDNQEEAEDAEPLCMVSA